MAQPNLNIYLNPACTRAALRTAEAELPISQDLEAAVDAQLLLAGCQAAGPAAVPWVAALALLLGDSQPLLGISPAPSATLQYVLFRAAQALQKAIVRNERRPQAPA